MDQSTLIWLGTGVVLLIVGADVLVRGAASLATAMGITPLVIGLTVVAFGTSAPELAVTIVAAVTDRGDIAMGNVIGSNILNVLLILGVSALLCPLIVHRQLVRLDVPLMIVVSAAVLVVGWDGAIDRYEGMALAAGLVLYVAFLIFISQREHAAATAAVVKAAGLADGKRPYHWAVACCLVVAGLAMLVFGSRWLVHGAVQTAKHLGDGNQQVQAEGDQQPGTAGISDIDVAMANGMGLAGVMIMIVGWVLVRAATRVFVFAFVFHFDFLSRFGSPAPWSPLSFDHILTH